MEINSLELELNLLCKVPLDRVNFRLLTNSLSFCCNIISGNIQKNVMKQESYHIRKSGEFNKAGPIL